MAKKIFEIEYEHWGGYAINIERRIADLFSGKAKVRELPTEQEMLKRHFEVIKRTELPTEVKWCECGEPKLFYVESAQCSLCYKFLNPMSKGGITNTKIGIPIKPQPKLEVPEKIGYGYRDPKYLRDKINETLDYLKSKEETQ